MPGIYCNHCKTKVIVEQDGKSCSNCGGNLLTGKPKPRPERAPPGPPKDHQKKPRHQHPIVDTSTYKDAATTPIHQTPPPEHEPITST